MAKPDEKIVHAKCVIEEIRMEHGVEESVLQIFKADLRTRTTWESREKLLKNALKELAPELVFFGNT